MFGYFTTLCIKGLNSYRAHTATQTDQPGTLQSQLQFDRELEMNLLVCIYLLSQNHHSLMRQYKYSLGINLTTLLKILNNRFYFEVLHVRVYSVTIAP